MSLQYSVKYIVKYGDTIHTIAQEHNTTIDKIMLLNTLSSLILTLGQELYIPIANMDNNSEMTIHTNQLQYRPVTAYTATRPIIVNGVDINTGLYPVLNFQPAGAEFPYIYVPIAEFRRVGARVLWDDARQIMFVTTDYYQLKERERTLDAENAYLRLLLEQPRQPNESKVNNIDYNKYTKSSSSNQYNREYRSVTAYTATRPILVNGVDINTGLYPVLNFQPVGAEFPYIYVPIAEFRRVGARVVWEDTAQIMYVTTDYYTLGERITHLEAENAYLRSLLEGLTPIGRGNTTSNIISGGFTAQQENWVYYGRHRPGYDLIRDLFRSTLDKTAEERLGDDNPSYINVLGDWIYYRHGMDNGRLYRRRLNGLNPTPLTSESVGSLLVVNEWIYYVNANDNMNLYRIRLDGTGRMKLNNDSTTAINVVGDWVYYSNLGDLGRAYRVRVDGTSRLRITEFPTQMLTVHGDWMYFRNPNDEMIYRATIEGTNPIRLSEDLTYELNVFGDFIYYTVQNPPGGDLYRMRLDGSERTPMNVPYVTQLNIHLGWIYWVTTDRFILRMPIGGGSREVLYRH